ncbi:uncharacterized protein V6R79_020258 [Siganus canaliculatus]
MSFLNCPGISRKVKRVNAIRFRRNPYYDMKFKILQFQFSVFPFRYLATGDSYRTIANSFRVGVSSVSRIVPDVASAIWDSLVVLPDPNAVHNKEEGDSFDEGRTVKRQLNCGLHLQPAQIQSLQLQCRLRREKL